VLIGTAHGNSLSDVLRNTVLKGLVGGVNEVTLGDEQAKKTNNGKKARPSMMQPGGQAWLISLFWGFDSCPAAASYYEVWHTGAPGMCCTVPCQTVWVYLGHQMESLGE